MRLIANSIGLFDSCVPFVMDFRFAPLAIVMVLDYMKFKWKWNVRRHAR